MLEQQCVTFLVGHEGSIFKRIVVIFHLYLSCDLYTSVEILFNQATSLPLLGIVVFTYGCSKVTRAVGECRPFRSSSI
jgi:hypothetical protein